MKERKKEKKKKTKSKPSGATTFAKIQLGIVRLFMVAAHFLVTEAEYVGKWVFLNGFPPI